MSAPPNPENYFVFINDSTEINTLTENGYSIYLQSGTYNSITVKSGIDVGEIGVMFGITYNGEKDVLIRTNQYGLTVNAPNGSVSHYGDSFVGITIKAVSSEKGYHEYGAP